MYAHRYRELTTQWCIQELMLTGVHWEAVLVPPVPPPNGKALNVNCKLLEGLKSLLQNFHDDDEPQMIFQPSQPMPSQPQTLLGALQQLVAHAESHPENLLSRLKQLVSDACEGKLVSEPADSKTQTVNRHTTHRQQHTNIQGAKLTARGLKLPQPTRNPSATKSAISQKDKTTSRLWADPNDKGSVIQVKLQLPSFVLPISRQPPNWEHRPKLMGLIEPARLPLLSCMVKHRVKPNNDGYMSSLLALVLKWKTTSCAAWRIIAWSPNMLSQESRHPKRWPRYHAFTNQPPVLFQWIFMEAVSSQASQHHLRPTTASKMGWLELMNGARFNPNNGVIMLKPSQVSWKSTPKITESV